MIIYVVVVSLCYLFGQLKKKREEIDQFALKFNFHNKYEEAGLN